MPSLTAHRIDHGRNHRSIEALNARLGDTTDRLEASEWRVAYVPTRRVRGWPEASSKPFHLLNQGDFVAAYATYEALRNGLSAYAG
jgi:hypothetical protein